jgi:hypothetical protein
VIELGAAAGAGGGAGGGGGGVGFADSGFGAVGFAGAGFFGVDFFGVGFLFGAAFFFGADLRFGPYRFAPDFFLSAAFFTFFFDFDFFAFFLRAAMIDFPDGSRATISRRRLKPLRSRPRGILRRHFDSLRVLRRTRATKARGAASVRRRFLGSSLTSKYLDRA